MTQTTMWDQAMERLITAQSHLQHFRETSRTDDREVDSLPAWSIALTQQAGTEGTAVSHEIGARLDWHVYDHELLEMIAEKAGLDASLLESVDERRKSWLIEYAEGFTSSPGMSEIGYSRLLVETVRALGSHGHCVILGRGAAQILPPQSTLRVSLVGQHADRVHNISNSHGLSLAEAERFVREKDHESVEFVKSHFFKDPVDPTQCDLLLNRSRWSVAECADLIIQALEIAEQRTAEASSTNIHKSA